MHKKLLISKDLQYLAAAVAASIAGLSPASAQDWQAKEDGGFSVTARNTQPFSVSGSTAPGSLEVRVDWSDVAGSPREDYATRWDAIGGTAARAKLLAPFASSLPGNGDYSDFPRIVDAFGELNGTDVGVRIEFVVRAPRKAIKGESFFENCKADICILRGTRDLGGDKLPIGPIGRWNDGGAATQPPQSLLADWQAGCRVDRIVCQRNSLAAATHIAVTGMTVWKLTYDGDAARELVGDWAKLAFARDADVVSFRRRLGQLTARDSGGGIADPRERLTRALQLYTRRLEQLTELADTANSLDRRAWASGIYDEENRYAGELKAAIGLVEDRRRLALSQLASMDSDEAALAKYGVSSMVLTPAQVTRLRQMEANYADIEAAILRDEPALDTENTAALERAALYYAQAEKAVAERLVPLAQQLDAAKREYGVLTEDNSHETRAARLRVRLSSRGAAATARLK